MSLRVEYLPKLFGILLDVRFSYSLSLIYVIFQNAHQSGPTHGNF